MPILDERALVPLEEGDRHIPLEVIDTVPAAAPPACPAGKPPWLRSQQNRQNAEAADFGGSGYNIQSPRPMTRWHYGVRLKGLDIAVRESMDESVPVELR